VHARVLLVLAAGLLLAGCVAPSEEAATPTPTLFKPAGPATRPAATPRATPEPTPEPITVATATVPPGGYCEITRVYPHDFTSHSAQISWFTNRRAQSSIEYEIPGVPDSGAKLERITLDLEHLFRLEYLQADTLYYYRLTSCCERDDCDSYTGSFWTMPS
jgi:hypothetical protein